MLQKVKINEAVQVQGVWTFIWSNKEGIELRRQEDKNLVVDSGLYALAAIIIGELNQNCAVFCALGTGSTAVIAGDTALDTETTRKIVTTRTRNSGQIIYRFYFLTGEAVGDYTEAGVFLEATTISGSGRLLNRLLPAGGISKDSNENLIIEVTISLAAS